MKTTAITPTYLRQLILLYFHKFRWIKFGLVGLIGSIIQFSILYSLTEFARVPYPASATIAGIFAVTSNYTLNHRWTFADRKEKHNLFIGWTKYLLMAGITFPAYLGLLVLLTEVAGIWYILSAAITILIMFVANYKVAGLWIWKKQRAKIEP